MAVLRNLEHHLRGDQRRRQRHFGGGQATTAPAWIERTVIDAAAWIESTVIDAEPYIVGPLVTTRPRASEIRRGEAREQLRAYVDKIVAEAMELAEGRPIVSTAAAHPLKTRTTVVNAPIRRPQN
ncbi:MAG: hypothetical protein ACAI38_04510 [Myxococcota bacterium]